MTELDSGDNSDEGEKSSGLRRKPSIIIILLGVLVVGLALKFGLPPLRRWVSDPYVVSPIEAVCRPYRGWGQNGMALELDVGVECNARKPIAFTKMTVDSITDDQGAELLGGPLWAGPDIRQAGGWIGVLWQEQGGWRHVSVSSSDWPPGYVTERFAWQVGIPNMPSAGAKSVRVKGRIDVWDGGKLQKETLKGVKFEERTAFKVAGVEMDIISFSEAGPGNSNGTCVIRVRDPELIIEGIEAGANEFGLRPSFRQRIPGWAEDSPEDYSVTFNTAAGATSGDVTFSYRVETRHLVIPVNVDLPIRVMSESEENDMYGTRAPKRVSPDDADWGVPMSEAQRPEIRIKVGDVRIGRDLRFPESSVPLRIEVVDGPQPRASQIWIDHLVDGEGRDLLKVAPLRSDEYRQFGVESWEAWNTGVRGELNYSVKTWTTGALKGTGVYRGAFGRDEAEETVPGTIDLNVLYNLVLKDGKLQMPEKRGCGSEIKVGKVRMLPQRVGSDFIEMIAIGNLGLVREIAALDGEGKVLAFKKLGEQAFHSKERWFSIDDIKDAGAIRAWRVRYFRDSEWFERPFTFEVAEKKE